MAGSGAHPGELDLATLRAELAEFESRYLRTVGVLYAELDEIEAQIAEAQARSKPSDSEAQERARRACSGPGILRNGPGHIRSETQADRELEKILSESQSESTPIWLQTTLIERADKNSWQRSILLMRTVMRPNCEAF